ncbi:uncharacterized protein LOC129607217 isoform X4 [Condylostylus longicornis]|uniref:uncharacterized protein LOC129607217 isoform X4 n=1 Tax=Condylostylus longicornis TaxID=2530218 RepID=UPI00244E3A06|nr:uncharacterized protein LOC129607217 isoform X4 [Condylostylus longicornis]
MSKFAWVTLTTNDTYSLGALVLANSLKRVGTAHQLAVLVTPNVSDTMKSKLKDAFNVVQEVDVLDSKDEANLALLARPELGITFTKLHCWRLVQFEKCVFLDADILVLQNSDELFEREELSAAPDVSWPDCFNSGVFVYRPNLETFNKLIEFAVKNGSFDGGDQGLLNQYFSDWATKDISKHLPFTYNTAAYAAYCYLPAFKQFRDRIKILHFAGKLKPWLATFDSQNRRAHTPQGYEHAADFIQLWWNIFCDQVHQSLHNSMFNLKINEAEVSSKSPESESGLAGVLSTLRLGEAKTPEQEAYEQAMRRQCWESGNIDYTGKDSFDNIWKKISQTIDGKPKSDNKQESASRLTSADIEDGKIEFDKKTGATILYKIIPGGWTKTITTQQPNGTKKSETKTFYDPVPVTDEEEIKKLQNRTDGKTTVEHRKIPGGREEIHTTVYPDGTSSTQIKTFYDSGVDVNENETTNRNTTKKNTTAVQKVKKQDSQDNQIQEIQQYNRRDSKNIARQEKNIVQQFSEETVEEHRRVTKVSGRQVTKTDSVEEQQHNVQAIQSKTGKKVKKTDSVEEYTVNDKKDVTKKKKRTAAPPPPTLPPEFADGKTTVTSKKINGGTEYTYTTVNKEGKTMISTKTVYEEEEVDMTEEEIKQYQKQLKEAKKHENLQTEKTLKTKDGSIKKVVPSENPGDVTTVEEKRIPGGTEYHYTTVTKEGIVKKSSKTIYDPVPVEKKNGDDTSEEEIIEEYEEEVIAPGEQVTKTIVKNVQMVKEEKSEYFFHKKSDNFKFINYDALLFLIFTILTIFVWCSYF